MERNSEMDQALKEALQDSLPENHPGHVPSVERIDREESIWLRILNMLSMTAIQNFVEDQIVLLSKLSTIVALKKILETNVLDEIYAICHEQLGEHERAKELREFVVKKAAEPKDPDLFAPEDELPDWLKLENHPSSRAEDWDRASNYDDPFYHGGRQEPEESVASSDEVERGGDARVGRMLTMRYALVRTKGRKTIRLYYLERLSAQLRDEDLVFAAQEARKRGWRRAMIQIDQYLGETIEMLNLSEFYTQHITGRPGIYIRSIDD